MAVIWSIVPVEAKTLTGSQILDEAAKRVKATHSVTVTYDMSDGQQSSSGTLVIAGEKFHLSSPDHTVDIHAFIQRGKHCRADS